MPLELPVEGVYVVPRNGYANRLQAWASAAILAAHVDAPLHVVWESEPVAAAEALDLFDERLVSRSFADPAELEAITGMPHHQLPRYLTYLPERSVIVLAGHDLGEQHFMLDLVALLDRVTEPVTLVIVAGGKFHLPSPERFDLQRRIFYESIAWSEPITSAFTRLVGSHPDFVALHVRQTDRSVQAPPARALAEGLARLREAVPTESLFIAADTTGSRQHWSAVASQLGFAPWLHEGVALDRATRAAGVDALVDWRLLAAARGIVYPAASTFSAEAVIAGGAASTSFPVTATALRQRARSARNVAADGLRFARRRLHLP